MRNITQIKRIATKSFMILWATAIFWFYLGNLINFHQNRIWGKILIPACYTHSSVNNKDFGMLQDAGDDSSTADLNDDFVAIVNNLDKQPLIINEISNIGNRLSTEQAYPAPYSDNYYLRGPPRA